MPSFSSSDINEAKRRVREMQERARAFSPPEPTPPPKQEPPPESPLFGLSDFLGGIGEDGDAGRALVLALILILSREKADNMLILALLYILL